MIIPAFLISGYDQRFWLEFTRLALHCVPQFGSSPPGAPAPGEPEVTETAKVMEILCELSVLCGEGEVTSDE